MEKNKIFGKRVWIALGLIMFILLLDMVTTYIGISRGGSEANWFMWLFYQNGLFGYILAFIFYFILVMTTLVLLPLFYRFIFKKTNNREMPIFIDNIIFWTFVIGIFLLEAYTVIHNIITISNF